MPVVLFSAFLQSWWSKLLLLWLIPSIKPQIIASFLGKRLKNPHK
jgi:hypothetical protein